MSRRRGTAATLVAAVVLVATSTSTSASAPRPASDVIVRFRDQPRLGPSTGRAAAERALRRAGGPAERAVLAFLRRERARGAVRRVERFWIFSGLRVVADRAVVARLARSPAVASVRPNATVRIARLTQARAAAATRVPAAVDLVGAPRLWRAGVRGAGVVVASIDTGVDGGARSLAASYRGGPHDWFDATGGHAPAPVDASGHGTWTMGVMVGSGTGGAPPGIAPAARWIAARIFDRRGRATTSGVHAALQWALDPDGDPATDDAPDVLNSSWSLAHGGCDLEFEADLRNLRAAGILPVFATAAGDRDASPANNPSAFAVGAVDAAGTPLAESARGPSTCDGGTYPRLVAPGVDVPTTDLFGLGTTQSGSSIAAPHAAGALALLLSRFPGLSAARQEAALESTAADLGRPGSDDTFGAGRLDVAAAARWLERRPDFTLQPARWALGVSRAHPSSIDVTVRPAHGFRGHVRIAATGLGAAGALAIAPTTVPAGARARLVARVTRPVPPGTYPVTVVASSGAIRRRLTVAILVRRGPRAAP